VPQQQRQRIKWSAFDVTPTNDDNITSYHHATKTEYSQCGITRFERSTF
jgi:hypothetical protein